MTGFILCHRYPQIISYSVLNNCVVFMLQRLRHGVPCVIRKAFRSSTKEAENIFMVRQISSRRRHGHIHLELADTLNYMDDLVR
jgi:hypothetical protein